MSEKNIRIDQLQNETIIEVNPYSMQMLLEKAGKIIKRILELISTGSKISYPEDELRYNFDRLIKIIRESNKNIKESSFNFRVAGVEKPIKRERVYCGELLHQIRNRIYVINYEINPEPNKVNHPFIEEECGAVDPDFIVHIPGEMSPMSNLAVIEVKQSSGNLNSGLKKDIQTINCMMDIENGYYGGVIIIFGELTSEKQKRVINDIQSQRSKNGKKIILILHKKAGVYPEVIEIR
ncbi:MAG: hypothetical protein H6620_11675 [Halobacteriovoraceae bacterium]|nr:hypothetical protein [Halobacteriovoraceae bacterium]